MSKMELSIRAKIDNKILNNSDKSSVSFSIICHNSDTRFLYCTKFFMNIVLTYSVVYYQLHSLKYSSLAMVEWSSHERFFLVVSSMSDHLTRAFPLCFHLSQFLLSLAFSFSRVSLYQGVCNHIVDKYIRSMHRSHTSIISIKNTSQNIVVHKLSLHITWGKATMKSDWSMIGGANQTKYLVKQTKQSLTGV